MHSCAVPGLTTLHVTWPYPQEEQVAFGDELCRFCQLCGRFHPLDAFDDNRRSCRARLNKHNERRKQKNEREVAKPKRKSATKQRKTRSASPMGTMPESPALSGLTATNSYPDSQAEQQAPFYLDNDTLRRELDLHSLVLSDDLPTTTFTALDMVSLDTPMPALCFLSAPAGMSFTGPECAATCSTDCGPSESMDTHSDVLEIVGLWREWRDEAHSKPSAAANPLASLMQPLSSDVLDSIWQHAHVVPTLDQLIHACHA